MAAVSAMTGGVNASSSDRGRGGRPEIAMRTQTHMLNPNPKKCSAYHEAGHAVMGIIGGLRLKNVTIRVSDDCDPHCRWDRDYIYPILKSESQWRVKPSRSGLLKHALRVEIPKR